ncbi:MAG: hypothetical protein JXL81_09620 [Deltaproteobacteria bacterium]|nr:hypothetical protein [Deltaproteobacteria bacterium]
MSGKNNKFMRIFLKYLSCYIAALIIVYFIVLNIAEAGAREKLWNDIMLFVNFGVLVFLFIRFAKNPLINFLKGQGDRISEQLKSVESDVLEARSRMEAESDRIKDLDENLVNITKSIIAAGAREKESIIKRAQDVADKMISDAKKEAEFKMLSAKKRFSEEMLEAAVKITADKISQSITGEDDDNLIDSFASDLSSGRNLLTEL